MFVGHLGAGLAAKAVKPRLNLGVLFLAAMLLDAVLWLLVLAHLEQGMVPPDYAQRRYLLFHFPWSHSLLGAVILAGLMALAWMALKRSVLGAGVIGLVVLSHWMLDWLVHVPDMTLLPSGPHAGLGLWNHQPLALALELALAFCALAWFWMVSTLSLGRKSAVAALTVTVGAMTAMPLFNPAPPPAMNILAVTSLASILLVAGLAFWADKTQG
jgi:hypothetical protein